MIPADVSSWADGPTRSGPTIRDVAQAAGVSIGTVSKALSGRGKLRPETTTRVQAAAARLGFRPNALAHSLVRGRTFTVGLLTSDLEGRFSIPLLTGIEDALGDACISVFLCNVRRDPAREQQHLESLLAKRVDGIIITGSRTDPRPPIDLGAARVPVLYAFALSQNPDDLSLIPDNVQGGRIAAEQLVHAGRRAIAHVTGPESYDCVPFRRAGMLEVLRAHGLDCPDRRTLVGEWSEAWGYEAAGRLLDVAPEADAVFCGSDQIARGVMDRLREAGVRVPDDVAVVGFDNWDVVVEGTRPALTTVDMELEQLGRLAGRCLLDLIDGRRESGVRREPCRLVVRESCGANRPAAT